MMEPEPTPLEKMKVGLRNWRGEGDFLVIEDNVKGRCVLTTKDIREKEFVMEYEGDILTNQVGKIRNEIYTEEGIGSYMIWWKKSDIVLDATLHFRTLGRLVNHAGKAPNLEPFRLLEVESGKPKRLALRASRFIQRGEELMWTYDKALNKDEFLWADCTCPKEPHPLFQDQSVSAMSRTSQSVLTSMLETARASIRANIQARLRMIHPDQQDSSIPPAVSPDQDDSLTLESETKKRNAKITEKDMDMEIVQAKLAEAQGTQHEKEEQITPIKAELEKLRLELTKEKAHVTELTMTLEQAEATRAVQETQAHSLQQKLTVTESSLETISEKLHITEREKKKLEDELKDMRDESKRMLEEHNIVEAMLRKKMEELKVAQDTVSATTARLEEFPQKVQDLEGQIVSFKEELAALRASAGEKINAMSGLQAQLNEKYELLTKAKKEATKREVDLTNELEAATRREKHLETFKEKCAQLDSQLRFAKEALSVLEQSHIATQAQLQELTAREEATSRTAEKVKEYASNNNDGAMDMAGGTDMSVETNPGLHVGDYYSNLTNDSRAQDPLNRSTAKRGLQEHAPHDIESNTNHCKRLKTNIVAVAGNYGQEATKKQTSSTAGWRGAVGHRGGVVPTDQGTVSCVDVDSTKDLGNNSSAVPHTPATKNKAALTKDQQPDVPSQQRLLQDKLHKNKPPIKHRKNALEEEEILRDIDVPGIYLKKKCTAERMNDTVHACIFCGQLIKEIQKHLKNKHRDERCVVEIEQMKEQKNNETNAERTSLLRKAIDLKQNYLRNVGDHYHNQHVIHGKEGELLVSRRPPHTTDSFSLSDFGPCPHCHEWLATDTKHQCDCVC